MKRILILTTLLFIGLTGYSQTGNTNGGRSNNSNCCAKGTQIHYNGHGTVIWQTEAGKNLGKATPSQNKIDSPFEAEITTDKPLNVKVVSLSAKPVVWSTQSIQFQNGEPINLDFKGLLAGKYKVEYELDGHKSVKYFEYQLENKLLGGEKKMLDKSANKTLKKKMKN